MPNLQPRNYQFIAQLEQIEIAEVMKRKIENVRKRGNNNFQRNGNDGSHRDRNRKNVCRKPGHHHEWKDCPDNPHNKRYNRNKNESNSNKRDDDRKDK